MPYMERFSLSPHPAAHQPPGTAIDVEIRREPTDSLELHIDVTGDMSALSFPSRVAQARADGLWQRTCFEVFIRAFGDPGYLELNFSPSTEWAAYRFSGWRIGMTPALQCTAPAMAFDLDDRTAHMQVRTTLAWAAELRGADWRLGLAAILEDRLGRKSYWSLAHAPGNPDFHHADCFAAELPESS